MRVLYSTCFADPWIQVAQKLKEAHGYEPVYWIGLWDDNSRALVSRTFPDCIYHRYFDAWKGIFPSQVSDHFSESYINIDFLKEYASFELQAIRMMDRMDPDQQSFGFTERQRHYRNMIKRCTACLNYLKIDFVIFGVVPHQVFDYALYLLCRFYKIKFVILGISQFQGRFFILNNISSIGDKIPEDNQKILGSGKDAVLLKTELPDDIIKYYNKTQQDYSEAKPEWERNHLLEDKRSDGFFSLVKKFFNELSNNRTRYFGEDGFPHFIKLKSKTIEESKISIIKYSLQRLKTNRFKRNLKKYYASLTVQPDYNVKYVFFALHYQPEMTTSPSGDIFVDQRLCVEVLHKQLPSDCLIYVKEHQAQFYSHLEGHTSRAKCYYDDLLSHSRVRLIPVDSDPFKLVKNALAVATIIGTVGWEAMAMGIPVIAFGLTWYEKYDGVLKITNEETASKTKDFIANFKFDEKRLFAYLNAFCNNTILAYAVKGIKGKVDISENDCIDRIVKLILDKVHFDHIRSSSHLNF
jgi:hypothetical protein